MASGETSINKIQRPTILLDMEFVLVSMVKDSFNMGNVVPNPRLMEMGKDLFDKLCALRIHDAPGERLESFNDLSQDQINTLLDTANTICPVCKDDILAGHAVLLEHVHNDHVEDGAQTGGSTPEKATYVFTASDG